MNPTTMRRRTLVVSLATVCGLNACVSNDAGWETKPDTLPLPAVFVDSTAAQLQQLCPPKAGYITNGCAMRRYDIGRCFIYVEPNAPKWLATHELTHCAGFNHE